MADEVVHVVDPDNGAGADYTSLNAWNADQQRDLPTADEIEVAKCRSTSGGADMTAVTIDGWETDATRYIKIWTDPAESYRHDGKWASSKYRMDVAGQCMEILEDYVQVIGLQFDSSDATSSISILEVNTGTGGNKVEVVKCIFKAIVTGAGGDVADGGIYVNETASAASNVYVANCVLFDIRNSDYPNSSVHNGIFCEYGNAWAYNCTAFDCGTGFENGSYNFVAMNCLSNCDAENANQTDFSGSFDSSSDYNASSDATAPDNGHSRTSQTFTFADADNDDFHLDENDGGARTHGVDLSGDGDYPITDDIDGETRNGSWDIGADQVTVLESSSSSSSVSGVSSSSSSLLFSSSSSSSSSSVAVSSSSSSVAVSSSSSSLLFSSSSSSVLVSSSSSSVAVSSSSSSVALSSSSSSLLLSSSSSNVLVSSSSSSSMAISSSSSSVALSSSSSSSGEEASSSSSSSSSMQVSSSSSSLAFSSSSSSSLAVSSSSSSVAVSSSSSSVALSSSSSSLAVSSSSSSVAVSSSSSSVAVSSSSSSVAVSSSSSSVALSSSSSSSIAVSSSSSSLALSSSSSSSLAMSSSSSSFGLSSSSSVGGTSSSSSSLSSSSSTSSSSSIVAVPMITIRSSAIVLPRGASAEVTIG